MISRFGLAAFIEVVPIGAAAYQLIVFASVDCETVTVGAKLPNGNLVMLADVSILDSQNEPLTTLPIGDDGTLAVLRDTVDPSEGLLIEVDTGSYDNCWIVTPDDIERDC